MILRFIRNKRLSATIYRAVQDKDRTMDTKIELNLRTMKVKYLRENGNKTKQCISSL
jgi:hypothetical protein